VGQSFTDFRPTAIGYRKVGDYALTNARIGVRNERFGVYLFVNNIGNTIARTAAGNTLGGRTETVTSIAPRTFGLNLTGAF
jgi:hypothetical protein